MPQPLILIVDDERNIVTTLARMLELEDFGVAVAFSGRAGLQHFRDHTPDLILLDVKMPDLDGLEVLRHVKESAPDLPVVMMSGHSDIETAIRAIRLGAHDFIEKPLSSEKILITLRNALRLGSLADENRALRAEVREQHRMVGSSKAMTQLREVITRAAPSVGSVLIRGESGTGKELVARAIHEGSRRRQRPFIKLNCAAIAHELVESELFGHEKGSFTGALQRKKGKFELADEGTLFLDEIGDMRSEMQAKLLRVLQEGEFERVGGNQVLRVDVRIVAATNKDIESEIAAGRFREDLYYRIHVIPIRVPPLREHREDIADLVAHFIRLACHIHDRRSKTVHPDALRLLESFDYPGNVRELRNTCERLMILTSDDEITAEHVSELVPAHSVRSRAWSGYQRGMSMRDALANAERDCILAALDEYHGNVRQTAEALGLERSHFYKRMNALGIER